MSTSVTTFSEFERYGRLYTGGKAAVCSGGATLVCCCGEELSLLDLASGKRVLSVTSEADEITAFALHPHKPQLLSAGRSRMLRAWEYDLQQKSCAQLRAWKAHKLPVIDMAYDDTGTLVATAGADGAVMVFDVDKGFCTHVFRGHDGVVQRVLFQPSALRVASCGNDHSIRLWDLNTRSCLFTLDGHVGVARALAFSPDGGTLLTGGADQILNVWDLSAGKLQSSITLLESIESIAIDPAPIASAPRAKKAPSIAPPTLSFVTAGSRGILRRWRVGSNACVLAQPDPPAGITLPGLKYLLHCNAASAAGGASASGPGIVAVTEDHNLLIHASESLTLNRTLVGYNDEITDLKFVAKPPSSAATDGGNASGTAPAQLAVATNSEQIRLFELGSMGCRLLTGHSDVVLCVDVSRSGSLIASASKDSTVRIWDAIVGNCVGRCVGHLEAVGAVAFGGKEEARGSSGGGGDSQPHGIPFVLLSASKDKTLKRWDLSPLHAKHKKTGAVAKDAPAASAAEVPQLRCSSTVLAHAKEINTLAVAPNDRLAVTGSQDRTLKVWSLVSAGGDSARNGGAAAIGGEALAVLKGHRRAVWACAFSPVDRVAASGSGDMTVKVWSMADYSCLRTFEGHVSSVLKVLFLRAGTLVASSGSDGLVKLWSIKSSECVSTLDAHEDKVWALDAFEARVSESPAGDDGAGKRGGNTDAGGADGLGLVHLVSGSADSVIVRWKDTSAMTAEKASAESSKQVEEEQRLANALATGAASAAFAAALSLRRPRALLSVVSSLRSDEAGDQTLRDAVRANTAESDALGFCLECSRDWSTRAQHALSAHRLLQAILKEVPAATLAKVPKAKELLEAILPYAERHFERIDRLLVGTRFVGYILATMRMLEPDAQSMATVATSQSLLGVDRAAVPRASRAGAPKPSKDGWGTQSTSGAGSASSVMVDALAALGAALDEAGGEGDTYNSEEPEAADEVASASDDVSSGGDDGVQVPEAHEGNGVIGRSHTRWESSSDGDSTEDEDTHGPEGAGNADQSSGAHEPGGPHNAKHSDEGSDEENLAEATKESDGESEEAAAMGSKPNTGRALGSGRERAKNKDTPGHRATAIPAKSPVKTATSTPRDPARTKTPVKTPEQSAPAKASSSAKRLAKRTPPMESYTDSTSITTPVEATVEDEPAPLPSTKSTPSSSRKPSPRRTRAKTARAAAAVKLAESGTTKGLVSTDTKAGATPAKTKATPTASSAKRKVAAATPRESSEAPSRRTRSKLRGPTED